MNPDSARFVAAFFAVFFMLSGCTSTLEDKHSAAIRSPEKYRSHNDYVSRWAETIAGSGPGGPGQPY